MPLCSPSGNVLPWSRTGSPPVSRLFTVQTLSHQTRFRVRTREPKTLFPSNTPRRFHAAQGSSSGSTGGWRSHDQTSVNGWTGSPLVNPGGAEEHQLDSQWDWNPRRLERRAGPEEDPDPELELDHTGPV